MAGTLSNYGLNTNLSGVNGFGRRPAKDLIGIFNTLIVATTDTELVVPNIPGVGRAIHSQAGDKNEVLAIFGYGGGASTVFVGVNVASAAPANALGVFTAGSSAVNPSSYLLNGGDTLHFYTLGTRYISIEFYSAN